MSVTALIVDDSRSIREVIRRIIRISRFGPVRCIDAANGKDGLEILSREKVDVVLTGVHMPEVGGLEMLAEMRKQAALQDLPVVVVTSDAGLRCMKSAADLRCGKFVRKPFYPEEIKQALEDAARLKETGPDERAETDIDSVDF
jgi:two-component system, chemotaxis family, chemotaxis protein CheY